MEVKNSARQNLNNFLKKLADIPLISVVIPTINVEKTISHILLKDNYLDHVDIDCKLQPPDDYWLCLPHSSQDFVMVNANLKFYLEVNYVSNR